MILGKTNCVISTARPDVAFNHVFILLLFDSIFICERFIYNHTTIKSHFESQDLGDTDLDPIFFFVSRVPESLVFLAVVATASMIASDNSI